MTTDDEVPVQEMVVIHRIFRREFRLLTDLVSRVPAGDAARAEVIASHADFVLSALHNHHSSEDEYLWPRLVVRARPQADLIDRMESQHRVVAEHVERATGLLAEWRRAPDAGTTRDLTGTLTRLSGALTEHLDEEEASVLPLVSEHMTVAEWEELGQRAFDKFPRSALPLMLGHMLEVASPSEAALFLGKLPAPVRVIWRLSGRRRYARYVRRLRGGSGPVLAGLMRRGNQLAVALYRRSGGRIGGSAKGLRVLLITVPGRRTGTPHTVPVAYFEHNGGYLVTGSAGGTKADPQWFRNLRATSHAHIEIGSQGQDLHSRVTLLDERDQLWHDVVIARAPFFAKYEKKAGRTIPIAILTQQNS